MEETAASQTPFPTSREELPRAFGPYRLLRELGRGAMGVVYEAEDTRLGRRVALKVLLPGLGTDAVSQERFRREAQACASVEHPHVVKIHEADDVEGRLYYTMTLLEGTSLRERLREDPAGERDGLLRGLADVADALQALHDRGLVHRDVKPANIVVDGDGAFVLADFGLARALSGGTLTATGEIVGTPMYMSPEQIKGDPAEVDGRTDVYALGITLYEALTGVLPFGQASDLPSMVRRILEDRAKPPSSIQPTLSRDVDRVVLKCTEKEARDRYPDAASLATDLRALAAGDAVLGRPVPAWRRGARWTRAHPWVPVALVALAVVLWLVGRGPQTATLHVATVPAGEVALADGPFVATPHEAELDPGPVPLRLRADGFLPREVRFEAKAGDNRVEYGLTLASEGDVDALRRLAEARGFALTKLEGSGSVRSGEQALVQPVFPRGRVRIEDVGRWWVDLAPAYVEEVESATLVFEIEGLEPEPLTFEPVRLRSQGDVPESFRTRLAPGTKGTWSWVAGDGRQSPPTPFEVAAPDLDAKLAAIDELVQGDPATGEGEQPPSVRAYLRAQVFLEHGLDQAAWQELEGLWEAGTKSRDLVDLQLGILRRLYGEDDRRLQGLRLLRELIERRDSLARDG